MGGSGRQHCPAVLLLRFVRPPAGVPAARPLPLLLIIPLTPPSLPTHSRLESLEREKGAYERSELEVLGAHLPALTRLVLAGGLVGSHLQDW